MYSEYKLYNAKQKTHVQKHTMQNTNTAKSTAVQGIEQWMQRMLLRTNGEDNY